jgi:hypothetical protein
MILTRLSVGTGNAKRFCRRPSQAGAQTAGPGALNAKAKNAATARKPNATK